MLPSLERWHRMQRRRSPPAECLHWQPRSQSRLPCWQPAHSSALPTPADIIINADLFTKRPRLLSGLMGFTNIIGAPGCHSTASAGASTLESRALPLCRWRRATCDPCSA